MYIVIISVFEPRPSSFFYIFLKNLGMYTRIISNDPPPGIYIIAQPHNYVTRAFSASYFGGSLRLRSLDLHDDSRRTTNLDFVTLSALQTVDNSALNATGLQQVEV